MLANQKCSEFLTANSRYGAAGVWLLMLSHFTKMLWPPPFWRRIQCVLDITLPDRWDENTTGEQPGSCRDLSEALLGKAFRAKSV